MIILQTCAIIAGLSMLVGAPWSWIKTIRDCGFDPSDLLMVPIAMLLMGVGAVLVLGGVSGFTAP